MKQMVKAGIERVIAFLVKALIRRSPDKAAELVAASLEKLSGNPTHDIFYKHGFHLLRKHFYLPVPDESDISENFWNTQTELAGLEMNDQSGLYLLEKVFPQYMEEFRSRFPVDRTDDPKQFYLINGGYMAVDAHVYYAFMRHLKPKRLIEIGIGNSTILAGAANLLNQEETGTAAHFTAIDPYPWKIHRKGIPGLSNLIEKKVQDVDLSVFTSLEAGDILFIDSSHVLREGNDVQYEYLEILPRLAPGVLVHIHDISLPRRYPRVYFENQLYWNEQYLLQAFLACNNRFEVIWPGNYMMLKYPERVCAVFPEFHLMRKHYPMSEPSAFWIRAIK
ncbi:MAG: class I SAM-dependent methyltransferase [Nitrospirae bacterium]|nr:class I SAM-dependent methyltransferase [Nitrospirota bacterium]